MAGAVAVQVAREDVFESCHRGGDMTAPQEATSCQKNQLESMVEVRTPCAVEARDGANSAGDSGDNRPEMDGTSNGDGSTLVGDGERASSATVDRRSRLAPYKPGKMTVVLDMDECLLHSKFHGPGAASEAYRQLEERPDAVNEVNSFWVALEDGDTAQVNKRPGLDPFLEALARDYNTIVFTAAMPDYAGPVLDYIDPKGTLFHRRLYRSSCRQVKGAFLKDLSVLGLENTDMTRTVLVDNNPLSFICQPTNGVLVASFYDDPTDTALASVMQLIRYLDHAGDVRPILKEMFRLDTLLAEYRNALFDEDDPSGNEVDQAVDCTIVVEESTGGIAGVDEENLLANDAENNHREERETAEEMTESARENMCPLKVGEGQVGTPEALKDDDDESVETEPCSEESGESSLGEESLASREEMELDLEF